MLLGWALTVVVTFALFTLLERLVPRKRARIAWRSIALGATLLIINAALTTLIARPPAHGTLVRSALAVAAVELATYFLHRAVHRVPLLWKFHRVHHAHEDLTWSLAWRHHPIDVALFAGVTVGTTWLVGAPLLGGLFAVAALRTWNVVLHANLAWPATSLDRALTTPAFHARHHREDLPAANFAATLPVIDRLFGTLG